MALAMYELPVTKQQHLGAWSEPWGMNSVHPRGHAEVGGVELRNRVGVATSTKRTKAHASR
ncbi:hypothetical protein BRADI_3g17942v3 [Brachypodium distachyon]|uniref:Uncharacterized protein n=1 Tax=Brachypodium distachyon TaxID=15368 RepID=A0A0Q3I4P6_BRADI|nr:hypothetical protein BRADI_3g17942v3 [Brachypodium distachyon]